MRWSAARITSLLMNFIPSPPSPPRPSPACSANRGNSGCIYAPPTSSGDRPTSTCRKPCRIPVLRLCSTSAGPMRSTWQTFAEYLQDLPPQHFALKLRGQNVKAGKTRHLPTPRVDPQELREVEQEYLQRYFRSKEEIAPVTTDTAPVPVPRDDTEIHPAISFYQPINRRERLQ